MNRPLVVLGATGSIGAQALEVADHLGLEVAAIAAMRPTEGFVALAARYPGSAVALAGGSGEERSAFAASVGRQVEFGSDAVVDAARAPGTTVVNGIVGASGLRATVAALEAGNRVALANKESLVAGGPVVRAALAAGGGEMIPVDSEHSAIYQSLLGERAEDVARLILTASGGPFRGWDRGALESVTPEQALRHPTWDMGRRITIDSATLFNKGLELIEAHHLFDVPFDRIDVVIHPQSILHSAVELVDGSLKGHFGRPDMRIPIQYALTAPARAPSPAPPFSLAGVTLAFEAPDHVAFPAIEVAREAGRQGGSTPAVLNAADEVAVEAFLQHRLGFLGITDVVSRVLEMVPWREVTDVDSVLEADAEARATAAALIAGAC